MTVEGNNTLLCSVVDVCVCEVSLCYHFDAPLSILPFLFVSFLTVYCTNGVTDTVNSLFILLHSEGLFPLFVLFLFDRWMKLI